MRTQPTRTSSNDSLDLAGWRAELVDARGWLAGVGSADPLPGVVGTADAAAVAGVGTAGVGTAGVGTAGVGTAGVGTAGVGTAGVGTVEVGKFGAGVRRSAEPAGPRSVRARRRRTARVLAPSRSLVVDVASENAIDVSRASVRPKPRGELGIDGYRMGRWARLTLTVTVLAAIAVVTISLTVGSAPSAMADVTVGPGDTLWSIAAQAAPDRDPREVIEEIRQLNDMQGGVLPVGVVLRVPTSGG